MKNTVLSICAAVLAAHTSGVNASNPEGLIYVTPYIGGVYVDDSRPVEDDIGFGLAVGKAVNEDWNVEFNVMASYHDGVPDEDFLGAEVNILRVFYRDDRFTPYFLFGAGFLKNDRGVGGEDESGTAFSGGFGMMVDIGDLPLTVRGEIRLRGEFAEEHQNDLVTFIGLQIPIGGQ